MKCSAPGKFPCAVCFVDGYFIRHGVALSAARGVWKVRTENGLLNVWEDDIFFSSAEAQHAINFLLN